MDISELQSRVEANVQTPSETVEQNGLSFMVYGPPGVGKTYLSRTAPGRMFLISAESGMKSLSDVEEGVDVFELDETDPEKATQSLDMLYTYLDEGDHGYDWAALDSVSEIAELILAYYKEKFKDPRQAYGELATDVKDMMRRFRSLDMHVYFSAKQSRENTDQGMLFMPSFPGSQLTDKSPVAHDFDNVLSLQITEEGDGSLGRKLLTERRNGYEAKVRDPDGRVDTWEPADLGHLCDKLLS